MKKYLPLTPSLRHTCIINKNLYDFTNLNSIGFNPHVGRNNKGRITMRHRELGTKKKYNKVDYKRNIYNIPGKLITIEFDCYRSANIGLIYWNSGVYCYIIIPIGIKINDYIFNYMDNSRFNTFNNIKNSIGCSNLLKNIELGSRLYNIESKPFYHGIYCRSAGSFAIVTRKRFFKAFIRLFSIKKFTLSDLCRCNIGRVSNKLNYYINFGKAGRKRWLGIRPHVRGVAMNPVDHPHGGGEGKKTKQVLPRTPWN